MRQQVGIICNYCGDKVLKDLSEWKRNLEKGRDTFCSIGCSVADRHKKGILDSKTIFEKHLRDLPRGDSLSPFRYHLNNIKKHIKKRKNVKEFDITLEDLQSQWEKQNGICPYTGIKMENSYTMNRVPKLSPFRASLDRIDNSKGYILGNIEFVSYMAQIGKNRFSKEEFIDFCKQVAANHST